MRRRRNRTVLITELNAWRKAYEAGGDLTVIAREAGRARSTVTYALMRAGVQLRHDPRPRRRPVPGKPLPGSAEEAKAFADAYAGGATMQQVADRFVVSVMTVTRVLNRAGVKRRPRGRRPSAAR